MKAKEILEQLQYGTTMSDNTEPMLTNNRNIAMADLQAEIEKCLPEKISYVPDKSAWGHGNKMYNQALDDCRQRLREFMEAPNE